MVAVGMEGCPCLNTTSILFSLTDRHCDLPGGGGKGIQLTVGGSCVPFQYGASSCRQHDLLHDYSLCNLDQLFTDQESASTNNTDNGLGVVQPYCFRTFCFVDAKTCKKYSEERVYRSDYFGHRSDYFGRDEKENIDVFYSYSTCNSTADDWLEVKDDIVGSSSSDALGGIDIEA